MLVNLLNLYSRCKEGYEVHHCSKPLGWDTLARANNCQTLFSQLLWYT